MSHQFHLGTTELAKNTRLFSRTFLPNHRRQVLSWEFGVSGQYLAYAYLSALSRTGCWLFDQLKEKSAI
jgi:hypothetical protein